MGGKRDVTLTAWEAPVTSVTPAREAAREDMRDTAESRPTVGEALGDSCGERERLALCTDWRVPAGSHPFAPDHDGDPVIQLERDDGCPAAGRLADNPSPVLTPIKVFSPALSTRIEEIDQVPALRIATLSLSCFESVA